jgi:hypothetical protein
MAKFLVRIQGKMEERALLTIRERQASCSARGQLIHWSQGGTFQGEGPKPSQSYGSLRIRQCSGRTVAPTEPADVAMEENRKGPLREFEIL